MLNARQIEKSIALQNLKIDVVEKIDSTNEYLKQFYGKNQARVCLAESQTHGKGRFERHWHSPFGQNIYFSMLYPFAKGISELSGLSLVVGLAVCKAIEETVKLSQPLSIKWPNDIVIDNEAPYSKLRGIFAEFRRSRWQPFLAQKLQRGSSLLSSPLQAAGYSAKANKKLAGILLETYGGSDQCEVIIGIGINVNMAHDIDNPIDNEWISLQELTNAEHDRNLLCSKLIDTLADYIERFVKLGLAGFLDEWHVRDSLFDQTIRVKSHNGEFQGKAKGIDAQGNLLLKFADGEIASFSSGETTITKRL
jgi:BirA family biotin operon repressor/biotin-[acetyl-CoA-carboxylase] ligase